MKSRPISIIVLPSTLLGGAEKRLLGLFLYLRRTKDWPVAILCPRALRDAASASRELSAIASEPDVLTFESTKATFDRALVRAVAKLRRERPRAILHVVLVPPQLAGVLDGSRTLYTVPNADMMIYNWRGRSMVYAGSAIARRTDFLEVKVRDDVAKLVPWARSRFRVTPGSFVDLDLYQPKPANERNKSLVFLGRFSRQKGAYRLAEQLPEIHRLLAEQGITDVRYRFMGRDAEEPPLTPLLRSLAPAIDVSVGFESNPQDVLASASVFFSLQVPTNYPSKSLLEAMAAGCIPVVTDVGRTREMVTEDYGYLVPERFTAKQISDACAAALTLSPADRDHRVSLMRAHLAKRFALPAMAEYYVGLYREIDESNASTA
jgi:glycosyltransferase involved in cell wall biosynthesis